MKSKTTDLEILTEGQRQTIQYEANNPTKSFGILPANLPYALNWNVDVEFTHCYFCRLFKQSTGMSPPSLLDATAA